MRVENLSQTLTEADVLRAQSPTLAGRIFTTSLKFDSPFVFFTNEQYLAWTRAFLGLPPASTLGNHVEHKDFDYPVQTCLAEHHGSKFRRGWLSCVSESCRRSHEETQLLGKSDSAYGKGGRVARER